jgi:LPXTG-motif cell wall-anchored protein
MKLTTKICLAVVLMTTSMILIAPTAEAVWCTDCVGPIPNGDTYIITPGLWTRNGVVVGITFPNGDIINPPPPPNTKWDQIWIDPPPNDFHYNCDLWYHAGGAYVTHHAGTAYFNDLVMGDYYEFPTYINDGSADSVDVYLALDFSVSASDPPCSLIVNGNLEFTGNLSGVDPILPGLGLEKGGSRQLGSTNLPSTTNWGLFLLILIVAISAAWLLLRRRRRAMAL